MNRIDLRGRKAIITGGASGIGLAIADRMLASGADVILWDFDLSGLDKAVARFGPRATGMHVDVSDFEMVAKAAVDAITGGVDILVNNAGIAGPAMPSWEYETEDWNRVLAINPTGCFYVCKALARHLADRPAGRIVNIASVAGKEGNPNACAYSASKAGMIAFTKSLAKELAGTAVRVNAVAPAVIDTPLLDGVAPEFQAYMLSKVPLGRFGRVDEVAAMVAWLASDECSFSTGAVFDLSGGRATY